MSLLKDVIIKGSLSGVCLSMLLLLGFSRRDYLMFAFGAVCATVCIISYQRLYKILYNIFLSLSSILLQSSETFRIDPSPFNLITAQSPVTKTNGWINLGLWDTDVSCFAEACERLALRLGKAVNLSTKDTVLDVGKKEHIYDIVL